MILFGTVRLFTHAPRVAALVEESGARQVHRGAPLVLVGRQGLRQRAWGHTRVWGDLCIQMHGLVSIRILAYIYSLKKQFVNKTDCKNTCVLFEGFTTCVCVCACARARVCVCVCMCVCVRARARARTCVL